MRIRRLIWDDTNLEHIARHRVIPEEVDEVCLNEQSYATRIGRRRYQVIGQTRAGRYLTIFLDYPGGDIFYPVTARDATDWERRLWRRKRG